MLDGEKSFSITEAFQYAHFFYDEETYQHAMRVAGYVSENYSIPSFHKADCVCLAIMHDLIEDTDFDIDCISDNHKNFKKALLLLTKNNNEKYEEYCKRILPTVDKKEAYQLCAYWVKLADIKDHLSLTETLTEKRKEKYIKGLAILL